MNVIVKPKHELQSVQTGYIFGVADGIVTVAGIPASRWIVVMSALDLSVLQYVLSYPNGRYLITNLDPNQKYLIMARDYKGEYEPVTWDNVVPMSDKTLAEQMELWQTWQQT